MLTAAAYFIGKKIPYSFEMRTDNSVIENLSLYRQYLKYKILLFHLFFEWHRINIIIGFDCGIWLILSFSGKRFSNSFFKNYPKSVLFGTAILPLIITNVYADLFQDSANNPFVWSLNATKSNILLV